MRSSMRLALLMAGLGVAGSGSDAAQPVSMDPAVALVSPTEVQAFYEKRADRAIWLGPDCERRISALLTALDLAYDHGLNPARYHRVELARAEACRLDATEPLATDAWLSLALHLHAGSLQPARVEPDWSAQRPEIDAGALLDKAVAEARIVPQLFGLAPRDATYAAMREALARFRSYLGRGGWAGVDAGPTLRPGERSPRVLQLRARLALGGLLPGDAGSVDDLFDAGLEQAVKAFQRRANLEPDGVVGALTLEQLNRRAEDRIDQLRVNLERWRWLPEDIEERHVRVNIADFSLQAWDRGRVEREHRVIVGRQFRRTPSFSGRINRIVFNPWWETPRSIALRDKLPAFRKDPGQVQQLGFEILDAGGQVVDPDSIDWSGLTAANFPYRLRQRPGPRNALGKVKILFPNSHSVYLHDTPTQGLFARVRRDFSSGCIRVEDALGLAEWLLGDTPGWDRARIDAATTGSVENPVALRPSVPVHLVYLTVVEGWPLTRKKSDNLR